MKMWTNLKTIYIFLLLCIGLYVANASIGDRSPFFINCMRGCRDNNCTEANGLAFKKHIKRDLFNDLLLWSCNDECTYACMWRTTNLFVARNWIVPKFYGKWPFKRFFGIQEPASVFFSALNLIVHWSMIRKFRREVRKDSPMYYVWHMFCAICINAWIFSIIFHTRDVPLTELLDYIFAYSMVLGNFYCMVLRMLNRVAMKTKSIITLTCFLYFANHCSHFSVGHIDYGYNMKANITTGILAGVGWVTWYLFQRKRKPYAVKILLFQMVVGMSLLLEINDFPPVLWVFDAHSVWHLSTVLPTLLLYSFIIDDTKMLRSEKLESLDLRDDKEKFI